MKISSLTKSLTDDYTWYPDVQNAEKSADRIKQGVRFQLRIKTPLASELEIMHVIMRKK